MALFGVLGPAVAQAAEPVTHEALLEEAGWAHQAKVKADEVGTVRIETRTIGGKSCVRALAQTDVAIAHLLGVVVDVAAAPAFLSQGPTTAPWLHQQGDETVYVQYMNIPGWTMMSDRFWFARAVVRKTSSETFLQWDGLADPAAEYPAEYKAMRASHPKAVEPELNVGSWGFRRVNSVTHMRYSLCTDVGGSVPQWVQNTATRSTLPTVVTDVVREARRRSSKSPQ